VGALLAPRFFCEFVAQNFCAQFAGFIAGNPGDGYHRRGGIPLQLKMWILSGTAIALWLTPMVALDKKVTWHKAIQGLSLGGAVACAIGAGNIARRLAEENEIEAMKARAIKEDTEDEIATEVYVSQKQRQQEAEAILGSGGATNTEEARKQLEAMYKADDEEVEVALATTTDTSLELAKALYGEVKEAMESGKSSTWIIENILKMKGRKFAEGKLNLQNLLNQFEGE